MHFNAFERIVHGINHGRSFLELVNPMKPFTAFLSVKSYKNLNILTVGESCVKIQFQKS